MGLILSEPIKNVVKILKMLVKTSVEDAETHPKAQNKCKRKTEPAKGSRRKAKKKKKSQAEGKNMGRKTVFWLGASVFSYLALHALSHEASKSLVSSSRLGSK
jgi:hypothetical protein